MKKTIDKIRKELDKFDKNPNMKRHRVVDIIENIQHIVTEVDVLTMDMDKRLALRENILDRYDNEEYWDMEAVE